MTFQGLSGILLLQGKWVMHWENTNSDITVLLLARVGDSFCQAVSGFLQQQGFQFAACSSVFELLNHLNGVDNRQMTILLVRPAMLSAVAASFLQQNYRDLQMIGWLDKSENMSDRAFPKENDMILVSHFEQLLRIIRIHLKERFKQPSGRPENHPVTHTKIDRQEYELSGEEVSALLGVE